MRAWVIDSFEGIQKLRLTEVPDPKPGPGEVLLRVNVASLNPADAFLAQGQYPARPPMPHILGRDGVGEVVEGGTRGETLGILRCDVGVKTWGTLAELTAVPAASLAPVPPGWTQEQMAA